MNEKYEEQLWGQVDFLHQKSKRQQISFNYVMDMFNKFQESCLDFSKNIQSILNKAHEIIEYHSTSMYDAADKFLQLYETFPKELKEAHNSIKKQILDPILKSTNEEFNKEKDLYNNYNKYRTQYNNSKLAMEKHYKNYENNMKLCENIVFNCKHMNALLYVKEDEKAKNAKNANNSIKSTKTFEEKYINSIDLVNKARENEISKQNELLKFYQKLDINFYEKIKLAIGLYLAIVNKMCSAILQSADLLGKSYQQISVENDIQDYISKNKLEKKLQQISKFVPYVPFSDPTNQKEDSNKLDIYFEVLKTLKLSFKNIRDDINIQEEGKRKRLRYLCERIFKFGNNVVFSPEEKKELLEFLENKNFRYYFILVLTKQRTKGRFKRSESLVRDLSDLLLKILEIAENEKDYEIAKNCLILSQTYYYDKNEDKKRKDNKNDNEIKIYLFEFIKNHKWLTNLEFWNGLISQMIEKDIKNHEESNAKQGIEDNIKTKQNRLSNICFSQLLTFSSNMMDFGMDKNDVIKIVDDYVKQYELKKELSDTIYANIEMKQQERDKSTNNDLKNKENKENKEKELNKEKDLKKEDNINIGNSQNIEIKEDKDKNEIVENKVENNEKKEVIENIVNFENKENIEKVENKDNLEQKENEINNQIKEEENKKDNDNDNIENINNQIIENSELNKNTIEDKNNEDKNPTDNQINENNDNIEEKTNINIDDNKQREIDENVKLENLNEINKIENTVTDEDNKKQEEINDIKENKENEETNENILKKDENENKNENENDIIKDEQS